MSLVGFRPALKSEYEEYEYHHRARIAMKPGITGMWQVSGRSDITDFEEVVKLDTEYIRNWSMGLDFRILFKTVAAVLKRDGSMRYELEQGRIDEFAKLLNRHWEVSKKLDAGSTNTCIDQIFESCEDLIDGKFISGAGGGGFLQVILKKGVTKEHLRRRLRNVFQDSGVDMWESEFLW